MTLGAVRFTATLFPTRSSKKMLLQLYTLFPATHCKSCSTSMPFSRMTTHSASSSTSAASWCEPSVWTMRIGRGAVCRKGFRLTGTGDCDWYALCCKNEYCAGCGSRLNVPVIHPVKKAWAFWLIACLSQLSVLSKKICQLSTVSYSFCDKEKKLDKTSSRCFANAASAFTFTSLRIFQATCLRGCSPEGCHVSLERSPGKDSARIATSAWKGFGEDSYIWHSSRMSSGWMAWGKFIFKAV